MKNYINCLLIMLAAVTATAQTTTQNPSSSITAEQFIDQAGLSGMKEVANGKMAKRKAQDTKLKDFGTMMAEDHGKANTELMALAKSKNIKLPKQSDIMPPSSTMGTSGNSPTNSSTSNGSADTVATNSNTARKANQTTNGSTDNNKNTNNSTTTSATQQNQVTGQPDPSRNTSGMINPSDSLKMVTATDIRTAIQQLDGLTGTQFDTAYKQMMITDHKNAIVLFQQGTMSSDPDIKAFATKHLPTLRIHLQLIQSISSNSTPGQRPAQGTTGTNVQ